MLRGGQCRRSARKGGTRRSGERIRTVQSLHDRRGQTGGRATGVFRDRWGRGLYHAPDRGCRLRLCLPGKRHDSLRHRKGMARRPYRFSHTGLMPSLSDTRHELHYHRWDICAPARRYGRKTGIRVYESLREPIIRKFGAEFYKELDAAAKYMEKEYRTE